MANAPYTGPSIVDYLNSTGQKSSFEDRSALAKQKGIQNYTGTAEQNTQLLNVLRGSNQQPASGTAPSPSIGTNVAVTSDSITNAQRDEENAKIKEANEKAQKLATDTQEAELAKLRSSITPAGGAPTAPSFTQKYEELRSSQGVVPIEDKITSIRSEKADLLAQFEKFKNKEPVGVIQGFATGRISEEGQNIQDRIDFLTRQEQNETDNLNNKNKYIETVMKLTESDYNNAVQQYNTSFSQNIQMQTAIQNYKNTAQAEENRVRDDSRAYLTSVNNMIQNSGKSWSDIDEGMKADINAAELKAGYAPGTMEAFSRSKPKANLIGSRDGYDASGNAITTLLYDDGLGGIKTTIVKTGGSKVSETEGTTTGTLRTVSDVQARLAANPNLTRADLQAEMDKDKTLSQSSITAILDEAKIYPILPSSAINATIDAINKKITEGSVGIFNTKAKEREKWNTFIDAGIITDKNGHSYKLTEEQKTTLKNGIK